MLWMTLSILPELVKELSHFPPQKNKAETKNERKGNEKIKSTTLPFASRRKTPITRAAPV